MKNSIKKISYLSLLAFLILTTSVGCRKKKDTVAEITVKNASGQVVAGAKVRVFPEPTQQEGSGTLLWDYSTTTNSAGVASFNFNDVYQLGQAGVVVANIEATANGSTGTGVIKVDQEATSTATVFL